MKISDADLERLRRLHADGRSVASLALEFGISRQHAGRLVRGDRRPVIASVADVAAVLPAGAGAAVDAFLAGLELDAGDEILAAAARSVAMKLDATSASDTAAAAAALPRLADALLEVLDRLVERRREPDALDFLQERRRARLFANGWLDTNSNGQHNEGDTR